MPMPAGAMLFNFLGHVRSAFLCERDGCDFPSELGLAAGGAPILLLTLLCPERRARPDLAHLGLRTEGRVGISSPCPCLAHFPWSGPVLRDP